MTLDQSIEAIYNSLFNDNKNIDEHIKNLRKTMKSEGLKKVKLDPSRLVQNNREGRKRLQSYFKKRGVLVEFN